jgi:hypothetical protein
VKGTFAFHYTPRLTQDELAWLRRFRIVVPGKILPAGQTLKLRRTGSTLLFYDWLTGFYFDGRPRPRRKGSWESFVYRTRPGWLLNAGRPDAGPDDRGRAYYYDPFYSDLRRAWTRRLSRMLTHSAYNGVFFDLAGSTSVPEHLRQRYVARHPDVPYDQALSRFLLSLRQVAPDAIIFTNQGYRIPEAYLPVADYDLTESLMTSYAWGQPITVFVEGEGLVQKRETFYRPWEELKPLVDAIQADVRRYNPAVKIFHLNYVNPAYRPTGRMQLLDGTEYPVFRKEVDRPAIYYGYAAAKLWGQDSYSPSEGVRYAQDEIYFADLGKPLGESYEERDGLVRRYYEKGIVALNPSATPGTANLGSPFIPADVKGLWDCYEGTSLEGFTVTIQPTISPASGRSYPAGRVYLYLR